MRCAGFSLWWLLLRSTGSKGAWASVVAAPRLYSTGLVAVVHGVGYSTARGIFLHQESNRCLLHWQADSSPLSHQESLALTVLRSTGQLFLGFPHRSVGKESACNAGDPGSIPGSERSPAEGNGNPLQYSCLENPMDGGAWQATIHGVARVRHDLAIL